MEENIKILERMLNKESKIYKTNKRGNKEIKFEVNSNYYKAIEHLIKAYKELEEFKKQVTEIENTNFIKYKNYIPVSLVEETIEELETKMEYENNEKVLIWLHKQRAVLEELLEKRK